MPKNLKSALALFQRLINGKLNKLKGVYSDEKNKQDHNNKLRVERLGKNNFKLKAKKCHFLRRNVVHLEHIFSERGCNQIKKIEYVKNFPVPSFLALVNYYRKYIPAFLSIAEPFIKL